MLNISSLTYRLIEGDLITKEVAERMEENNISWKNISEQTKGDSTNKQVVDVESNVMWTRLIRRENSKFGPGPNLVCQNSETRLFPTHFISPLD